MSRGNRRSVIFRDDADHGVFLTLLLRVLDRFGWHCHAWCLLTTHYHLLVTTPEGNVASGMQYLNSRYAEAFNARYALSGHLFQGRYRHVLVQTDDQLHELYRYVALNPVRAGICDRPDKWPWSSYTGLVRGWDGRLYSAPPLLAHFARSGGLSALRRLVEARG